MRKKEIDFWSTSSADWKLRRFKQNMFNIFTDIICHTTKFGWLSLYRLLETKFIVPGKETDERKIEVNISLIMKQL